MSEPRAFQTAGGRPAIAFEEIGSTSTEARRRAETGQTGPLWLTARRQSAGRGRLGRAWSSPDGNFSGTFLTPWAESLEAAAFLSFAAGLAVADALEHCGLKTGAARLKWPNDVRIAGAKIAGILVETGESEGARWVSIGIGVNLALAPDDVGQKTVALADLTDAVTDPLTFLEALDAALIARIVLAGDPQALRAAWTARAEGFGRLASGQGASGPVSGVVTGLGEDGALILRDAGGQSHAIRSGAIDYLSEEAV